MPAAAMVSEEVHGKHVKQNGYQYYLFGSTSNIRRTYFKKWFINTTCLDTSNIRRTYSMRYTTHKFECNSKSKINSQKQFDASG